ncbi:hypothetical protein [Vibrio parahaemolyticus]|uniref:hypothetical protein n=1 Tax=Vibrio parahaemolyticus TaxID=670 RepID=UPI00387A9B67|nr:hypothetical protein [Vibrio parahaemolyticus]
MQKSELAVGVRMLLVNGQLIVSERELFKFAALGQPICQAQGKTNAYQKKRPSLADKFNFSMSK